MDLYERCRCSWGHDVKQDNRSHTRKLLDYNILIDFFDHTRYSMSCPDKKQGRVDDESVHYQACWVGARGKMHRENQGWFSLYRCSSHGPNNTNQYKPIIRLRFCGLSYIMEEGEMMVFGQVQSGGIRSFLRNNFSEVS